MRRRVFLNEHIREPLWLTTDPTRGFMIGTLLSNIVR